MNSGDGNVPPPSVPDSAADISTSTANPATVPSLSPSDPLLLPNVKLTLGPTVMPTLNLAQFPLPPNVATSIGSATTRRGITGLSVLAFRRHQARDDLVHLLYVASLTDSPPLVEAVVGRLSSITRPRAAKRVELGALLLPDGSSPSPDDVKDLTSISRHADRYVVARGYHITKKIGQRGKMSTMSSFTAQATLHYRTLPRPTVHLETTDGLDLKVWYCLFARFGLSPLNAHNQVRSWN